MYSVVVVCRKGNVPRKCSVKVLEIIFITTYQPPLTISGNATATKGDPPETTHHMRECGPDPVNPSRFEDCITVRLLIQCHSLSQYYWQLCPDNIVVSNRSLCVKKTVSHSKTDREE